MVIVALLLVLDVGAGCCCGGGACDGATTLDGTGVLSVGGETTLFCVDEGNDGEMDWAGLPCRGVTVLLWGADATGFDDDVFGGGWVAFLRK